ncbi:MAG: hypothetical protein WDO13_02830 [Verrucomicrobiota bacterium]
MTTDRIAAQLYTLRDHLKTPAETAASLKKVRAIGYRAVQVSGLGPIADAELLRILAGEGLTCCATHEPSQTILEERRRSSSNCRTWAAASPPIHTRKVSISAMAHRSRRWRKSSMPPARSWLVPGGSSPTTITRTSSPITAAGLSSSTSTTRPTRATCRGEIDTYWVQAGGGDPVAWCRRLQGRLPLLHLKDYGVDAQGRPQFAELAAAISTGPPSSRPRRPPAVSGSSSSRTSARAIPSTAWPKASASAGKLRARLELFVPPRRRGGITHDEPRLDPHAGLRGAPRCASACSSTSTPRSIRTSVCGSIVVSAGVINAPKSVLS